jgi:tetratricopeptide (TPR) repeat protein
MNLTDALKQCEKTGLPLGRVLVLSGVLSESLLTTAVNAQILVRDKKLDKQQAIEALKQAQQRQEPLETTLKEKGFYELPNRSCPRLGELLTASGIITDIELINALELSLTSRKPIGEVLIDSKVITRQTLESALQIQRMIAESKIGLAEAKEVLIAVREGQSFEDAVQSRGAPKTDRQRTALPLLTLLKLLGCVDDAAVAQAFTVAQNNSQVISQVLLIGGVIDESSLQKAERCRSLVEAGRLTLEHAGILFDYSQRRAIDIPTALKELQWQHGDDQTQAAVPLNQPILEYTDSEFMDLRESAAKLVGLGNFVGARQILSKLAAAAKSNTEDDRYADCLDAIAETYMLEQDMHGAEEYYRTSLEHKLDKYGCDNLVVAFAINNMGKVAYFQKRYEEAEKFAREYIRICAATLGAKHPHVACGWQNVATICHVQDKHQVAEHAYRLAIDICGESLGDSHPTTIRLKKNYAQLLHVMAKLADARSVDPYAQAIISGNWRAIDAPSEQNLYERDLD